jgi:chromosome transmission fidelity protein 18
VTRPDERITLAAVVQIMLGLNLNFVQDRAEEGQLIYRLEPALDAFVQYEGKRSTTVGPARFAVRQMIAREMESAKLRMKVVGADAVGA